jgi:hypothetical protein
LRNSNSSSVRVRPEDDAKPPGEVGQHQSCRTEIQELDRGCNQVIEQLGRVEAGDQAVSQLDELSTQPVFPVERCVCHRPPLVARCVAIIAGSTIARHRGVRPTLTSACAE